MRNTGVPSKTAQRLEWIVNGCALVVMAIGLTVITGWLFGIEPLKCVAKEFPAMRFNTALGFIFSGAALYWRRWWTVRVGLGAVVMGLGALILLGGVMHWDFEIDRLFFYAHTKGEEATGRMAAATNVCFIFSSVALMLLCNRRVAARWSAEALAATAGGIGLTALLGYAFGVENLFRVPGFILPMALHSAVAFIILAVGILCALPEGMITLLLRSRGTGRLLWLGFGGVTALLLVLGIVSVGRLRTIAADVREQGEVARPRAAATRELEIGVFDFCLNVNAFGSDPGAWKKAVVAADKVAQTLYEYQQLAETPRQRELAVRFAALWEDLHAYGASLMSSGRVGAEELTHLTALRLGAERFLDEKMQPDAVMAFNAKGAVVAHSLQYTESLTLGLLIMGVVLALLTGGSVIRAVLSGQEALRESEERFRTFMDRSPIVAWIKDEEFRFRYVNHSYERLFDRPSEQLLGTTDYDFLPKEVADEVRANDRRVRDSRRSIETIEHVPGADGRMRHWLVQKFQLPCKNQATILGGTAADITELVETKEQLRLSLDVAQIGTWRHDVSDGIIRYDARALEHFGLKGDGPPEEVLARIHPEDRDRLEKAHRTVFDQRTGVASYDEECRVVHSNGAIHWVKMAARVEFRCEGEEHRVLFVSGATLDITARKEAEEALRESERRLATLVANLPGIAYRCQNTPRWPIDFISEGVLAVSGHSAKEFLSGQVYMGELMLPDDREPVWNAVQEALAERRPYTLEFRIRHLDGSVRTVCEQGRGVFDAAGGLMALEGFILDITERKQVEEALRREKKFADTVINSMPGMFYVIDANGHCLRWNRNAEIITGYSSEEISTMNPLNFVPAEYKAYVAKQILTAFEVGETTTDVPILTKDGRRIPFLFTGLRVDLETGPCLLGIATNVTEQKRAEEALRASEANFRGFFDNVAVGAVQIDLEGGGHVRVNDRYCAITGYRREELVDGIEPLDLVHPEDREMDRESIARFLRGEGPYDVVKRFVRKDGQVVWVHVSAAMVRDTTGLLHYSAGIVEDITERKRAEEELARFTAELEHRVEQRTAELASANKELEAFSYSVSHDLRAPLRAVMGFVDIFSEDYKEQLPESGRELLGKIQEQARKMASLIKDLLHFSRTTRQPLERGPVDLARLAEECYTELGPQRVGREIVFSVGALPPASSDQSLMRQVMLNLLGNAIKYTRGRSPAKIEVGAEAREREWVYFVKDNGTGFNMRYADKLFGVFQRLHADHEFEGTGVGLAIVARIIHRHGGEIWAEAEPDKGATFFFTLGKEEVRQSAD